MKNILVIVFLMVLCSVSYGQDIVFSEGSAKTWTLSITDDGQLEIDGKSVEKMSHPEIKAIMKEIAAGFQAQYEWHDRYLFQELEACQKRTWEAIEIADRCLRIFEAYDKTIQEGLNEMSKILNPKKGEIR